MALFSTQRLAQIWTTVLLWFRDTFALLLSWLPFDTSFLADPRGQQRRKSGKRILGRSGSSSSGSSRAGRSTDASGVALSSVSGGASPRRSRRLKGLAPAQGGSGLGAGGSSSSSGIPSSSSSSSESDQVTDSDSNASDAIHMRQLGRLRSGGGTASAAGGVSQRQAGRSRRTANGTGSSSSGGAAQLSHVHRSPTAHRLPRKTLVLDLDETLIHSTSRGARNYHHMVEVLVERHVFLYYVYKRPHCDLFLKKVCEWYKVVIFTASMPEYADPVIDWLDPSRSLFAERYFRQSCMYRNGFYVKDLSVIEPDLARVCLVDNSPISYQWNEDNGIPIETWQTDTSDEALLDMLPFLDALRYVEDVRHILAMK